MPFFRSRQHGRTGRGPGLPVADCVPATPPIRQGAETLPGAALVAAVDHSCAQRFPKRTTRGRPPLATRVLVALALLQHAWGCSAAPLGSRLRTDLAGMYACGLSAVQVEGSQEHGVRPDVLAPFRSRREAPWMEALLAIHAATAREDGVVSPAHRVVDPFPREPESPRVNAAATL
jgi:Transposase domain (DUF772)